MSDATNPDEKVKEEDGKPRHPWRDNIEAITMAIVMAVMLKYFIVEAYKIPTGSMQPTLMGNSETQIFDRILVDKLSYHFRDPERFEVVVFKYPLDHSKNFIKRLVGVGPEELMIRGGDLWVRPLDSDEQWQVLRRPRPVQEETWKALYPGEPYPRTGRSRSWRVVGAAKDTWRQDGGDIVARGSGSVVYPDMGAGVEARYLDGYSRKIRDAIGKYKPRLGEDQVVGDLRLAGEVSALSGCEEVRLELRENDNRYVFELPGPAAPADARPAIVVRDDGVGNGSGRALFERAELEQPFRLEAGQRVSVAAQNLDDLLSLEIDGEVVLELQIPEVNAVSSSVALHVEGEGADLSDWMVYRDIYYSSSRSNGKHFRIQPGHYVMLGDNTQDSSDSREWRWSRFRWPGVDGVLRGNSRLNDQEAPNPQYVPGGPMGTEIWFRDEWGELYHAPQSVVEGLETESAPYVPRNRITGRAVVVFWPFKWDLKLWRLKWIR